MKKLFVILVILVIFGTFILFKKPNKEPKIIEKTSVQKEEIRLNPVPIDWPVEKEDKG